MRESGASAKPEPKARPSQPARSAAAPARLNVPPPTLSEVRWIMGSDLPDLHQGVRKLSEKDCDIISKKMSFILRGWANTKYEDLSVEFKDFMMAMKKIYRSITIPKVADVVKYGSKNHFEIWASPNESLGPRFYRIPVIQGYGRMVPSKTRTYAPPARRLGSLTAIGMASCSREHAQDPTSSRTGTITQLTGNASPACSTMDSSLAA